MANASLLKPHRNTNNPHYCYLCNAHRIDKDSPIISYANLPDNSSLRKKGLVTNICNISLEEEYYTVIPFSSRSHPIIYDKKHYSKFLMSKISPTTQMCNNE